ncbi:putative ribonuclease H-like domain-containing protein [Tanacetum coccineum]
MDIETAQTNTTAKLPLLKQSEYDMWKLRIEQYFQVQDYALWDVIENGNSFKPAAQTTTNTEGTSTTLIPVLVTADEKIQKKNGVKARSMLLTTLLNEHLLTFNQYKDAKTLFATIQTRFGGNDATKKTHKTLLKQTYKNFSAPSTESLESIFNRLQKINLAFVSSTSSTNEVNTAYGVSTANTQVSTASTQVSTANLSDDTVYAFLASQPNGSHLVHEDLEEIHEDNLEEMDLKWQLALLSIRTRKFFQNTSRKITINGSDTARYDKNQDSSRRTINVEEISSKSMLAIDGAGFDWSFLADEEVPIDMALMDFQTLRIEFNKSEFNIATYKRGLASVEEQLVFTKIMSELDKLKQERENNQLKIEKFDNASKSLDKLIGSQIPDKSRKGLGFVSYNVVPPPPTGLFSPPNLNLSNSGLEEFQQPEFEGYGPNTSKSVSEDTSNEVRESPDASLVEELVSNDKLEKKTVFPTVPKINFANCNYHQREKMVSGNNYTRVNYNYSAKKAHPSAHKNIVPRAVLMKTGLRPLNTARPVNTAHPKTTVYSARPMSCFSKSAQSTVKRPYQMRTALTNKIFCQKVNTAKGKVNTARPKAVNTARPNTAVVNAVRENQGHPQKEDQGYVDSGCSRFTWVFFLASKDETSGILKSFITQIENLVDKKVKIIRCDNGTEFKNRVMSEFCEKKGIKREFSVARTPQQNGVAERRNRTLIEAARTMLADSKLPTTFWAEAVNTACYVQNRVLVVKPHNKTPYELFRGRTPSLSFMKPFGCHVTILNTLDHLGKFDGKSDDGFFVGYSLNSKAFRVYNIRTRKVKENLHVRFLEDKPIIAGTNSNDFVITKESIGAGHSSEETGSSQDYILMPLWKDGSPFDSSSKDASNDKPQPSNDAGKKDDEGGIDDQERTETVLKILNINIVSPTVPTALLESTYVDFFGDESELDLSNIATTYPVPTTPNTRIHKDHSLDHVLGDVQSGVQTRRMINEQGFISAVYEGKTHEDLHTSMQEELLQFKLQQVWTLVDLPYGKRAIRTKWVYRNKKDERGVMIRNNARLVAQGYTQKEGIDYDEVFALVARIEEIRLFLAYALFKDFVVYQIDAKSAFLYGKIEEEVYVCQPPGFEDPEFPDKVYKVEKELYGLHQAPRAWYETLSTYLLDNGFQRGQIDKNLFIKRIKSDILLVQVYVDDIIFGSTKKELCTDFEKLMHKIFQMSSMGELTFFLGLQVTQKDDGIFISQDKYVDEILKKFGFSIVKTASTPMETSKPLLKDAEVEDVDVHLYRSMIGSLMYLTASGPDIMSAICACARFQVTPKVSHLYAVKRIFRYLKGQTKLGLWYPKDSPFDLEAYNDSDYAGASLDKKSTTGGCQFLGRRLISWQCKKQTIVANSTTEVEYVTAASCCEQVLWIQNQILYYGYNFMNTKIFINNESTICIVKNPVFHSKTKHIEIRHHFIIDSNEKKLIQMIKIHIDHNVC